MSSFEIFLVCILVDLFHIFMRFATSSLLGKISCFLISRIGIQKKNSACFQSPLLRLTPLNPSKQRLGDFRRARFYSTDQVGRGKQRRKGFFFSAFWEACKAASICWQTRTSSLKIELQKTQSVCLFTY